MRALIIVDYQIDFLPGSPLGVPGGDEIVEPVNRLIRDADLVVATQDWHPANHGSFASNHAGKSPFEVVDWNGSVQTLWPDHCVQGSKGAELAGSLDWNRVEAVIRKGTDPGIDSYSAFYDNGHLRSTGLAGYLRERATDEVVVVGLATDYCVKFTALDAKECGFSTTVVTEASRGVGLNEGDIEAAYEEMANAGIQVVDRL